MAESDTACHLAIRPRGDANRIRGDGNLPRGEENSPLGRVSLPRAGVNLPLGEEIPEDEDGGVVGAAAGPVLFTRAGFRSGHVALAEEREDVWDLMEMLTKELTFSSLTSQTVDISVDDLILPNIDKLLADTITDLWPPKSSKSSHLILYSGQQPETVNDSLEIETPSVPSPPLPANLTTETSPNLPSVTSDALSPSHSALGLSFPGQVDNFYSLSSKSPLRIPLLLDPPFSSDGCAVNRNEYENGNRSRIGETEIETVLPNLGAPGDQSDDNEVLELDPNLSLEAMAAVLTSELPEILQETAVDTLVDEKLTGETEKWTCWPPEDLNCDVSVPLFENGNGNGNGNRNEIETDKEERNGSGSGNRNGNCDRNGNVSSDKNGNGNGDRNIYVDRNGNGNRNESGNGDGNRAGNEDRNGNGKTEGDAGILIEELMKEFGEEVGEAPNSRPMEEVNGQPLWNGALDNFEDDIGTETGDLGNNCHIRGSLEGRIGLVFSVEGLGEAFDHGIVSKVVDKVHSESCKEGEGIVCVIETAGRKSKKGRKRDVVKEEEAKKRAREPFLDESERTRRVNAVLATVKERELAQENSTLYCIRELKEASKLQVRGRRRRCDMDVASRLLDSSVRSNSNHLTFQHKAKGCQSEEAFEALDPNELLIVVEFMDPDRRDTKSQELIVCASQPLTALRDSVYCLHDSIARDANLSLPSAYFCIEDFFYNDMRDRDAKDESAPILEWNRRQRNKWRREHLVEGIFKEECCPPELFSRRMEETTFLDLTIQIGVKYVYLHQGGCKHVFQITDARLVHPTDVQNKTSYPVAKFAQKFRHRKCMACGILASKKVVYGDKMMPESPTFLCQDCYYCSHYSKDGKLLYSDFSVFDYYHE